ncbi:MAG: protein phosphatase 2C domain-containing protein, partial [bacterium]|nr:protein phosphatase 2C domain-containing protein [bacterium]
LDKGTVRPATGEDLMDNNFRFASASISDRGLSEKRPVNEDSFVELKDLGLFAVADGVGGAQAGDFASQMAMETLGEAFNNLPENFDAEQALRIAIQHANQSIFTMSTELPQLASMATTIAALHVNGNIATVAHVGDSRVYRIEPDGTLKRETADHSVVEEEVRAGRMTPEQALVHPSRNVISRALGAEESVEIDIKTIMIEPGTMFLLCSDGITRHIGDPELEQLFNDEIEPQVLCEQMRSICYSRGAEDNLTAVVVRVSSQLTDTFATPETVEPLSVAQTESTAQLAPQLELEPEEEETVATARSPFDEPIVETAAVSEAMEGTTTDEQDDEAYLLEEPADEGVGETEPEAEYSSATTAPAPQTEPESVRAAVTSTAASPFSYALDDEPPAKRGGGIFQSLLFLILGGAIGFAALWFWQQYNPAPQVPVLNDTKGSNITMVVFEETRRQVDSAPERFLAANAASPETPDDHYFLGRAQLLTGKYVEAQRQFNLAKEKLATADPANAKVLGNEIEIGFAIVNNPAVAETLTKALAGGTTPTGTAANSNSSSNVNAVVNQPIR